MACCFTQRLKIAQAPHHYVANGIANAEDSHDCHQPAPQKLALVRHSPAESSVPPRDWPDSNSDQPLPAINFQLHINLQAFRRYDMKLVIMSLMQAFVP